MQEPNIVCMGATYVPAIYIYSYEVIVQRNASSFSFLARGWIILPTCEGVFI